ncbi:unnamed protein product [Closterium sp. Naga37s-1]|nr:unnamed protein product [Closterium sp. Naga37s-1]
MTLRMDGPSLPPACLLLRSFSRGRYGAEAEAVAQRYGVAKRDLLDPSASDIAVWLALGEAHIVADTKRALLDAAEAVAQRYGVAKRDLLDPSASDTAVRLALGEAHIVADTKRALLDAGIDVALMEQFATAATAAAAAKAAGKKDAKVDGGASGGGGVSSLARSRSVILVKNLPFKVEAGELVGLFQRFGPVARFVLPPTNTVALVQMADSADAKRAFKGHVEMADSADAKRAFKGLAYKRYQHVPLYLEWAPEGIFLELAAPSDAPAQANITAAVAAVAAAASREAGRGAGEGGAREGKEGGGVKSIKKQGAVGLLHVVVDGKAARRMVAEAEMVGGVGGRDGGGEGAEGHAVEGEEDGQEAGSSGLLRLVVDGKAAMRMVAEAELVGGVEGLQDTVAKNLSFNPPPFLFHCLPVSSLPPSALAVSPHSPPLATTMSAHEPTIHSVFVKNLSFATTEAQLKEHLEKLLRSKQAGADGKGPAIRSITIKKRVRNGTQLSMGFGFVEFGSVLAAHRAAVCGHRDFPSELLPDCPPLHNHLPLSPPHQLMSMRLPCILSRGYKLFATRREAESTFDELKSTRLYGYHLVFYLLLLLSPPPSPLLQLKSMQLPRKFDGGHRGFVFVEFATKREAESAFDALKSTHLYGRHLVLERAKEGEELDELRAKTAGQFLDGGAGSVR